MCLLGFALVFSSVCEEWDHIATRAFFIVVASKSHPAVDKILKFIITGLGEFPKVVPSYSLKGLWVSGLAHFTVHPGARGVG